MKIDLGERSSTKRPGDWLVRWEPASGSPPELCHAKEGMRRLSYARSEDGAFAVLDGYLFDRPRSPSFAAQVLQDYQTQGRALLAHLRGGFALVLWEPSCFKLHLVRDAVGVRTCYYAQQGGVWLLSSSVDVLLAQPEVKGTWNRIIIAEHLMSRYLPAQRTETYYQEIHRVPPAHALTMSRGGLVSSRYWDPLPEGFEWASQQESQALPDALSRATHRCLSVGADSISLSGGFDSVSLAILAAAQTRPSERLHALSLHINAPECDEKSSQVAVASALHMPQIAKSFDEIDPGANHLDSALALSATSPSPVLSPWQGLYSGLFQMAHEAGLQDVILGTGGDEIFSVDPMYGIDLLNTGKFVSLWRFLQMWRRASPFSTSTVTKAVLWDHAMRPLLHRWKQRLLQALPTKLVDAYRHSRQYSPFPPWLLAEDRELTTTLTSRYMQKFAPTDPSTSLAMYVREIRTLPQSPSLLFEFDQGMAWAQRFGFTLLYPFFDQDLFALALRTRPEELTRGGWSKAPLRELVARRLPSVKLHSKKVDFTLMLHRVLRRHGVAAFRRMGRLEMLETLGLFQYDRLEQQIDDYFQGRTDVWWPAWFAMSTEAWLRARSS